MKSTTLKINQGYYFPLSFRLFAITLPFFALFFIVKNNYLLALLALAMTVLLLTTRYEIQLDAAKKKLHEYLWILGIKKGGQLDFNAIDKVIISKRNQTKTYNSRGSSTAINYTNYYLILLIDGEKVEFASSEKLNKIENIQKKLFQHVGKLPVENNT